MSPPPKSTPRKRGAQPGNQNAIKHGLYSRYLRQAEIPVTQPDPSTGFTAEINLLRYVILRSLEINAGLLEDTDPYLNLRLLENIRRATTLLSRLLLLHRLYFGEIQSLEPTLRQKRDENMPADDLLKPIYQPPPPTGTPSKGCKH